MEDHPDTPARRRLLPGTPAQWAALGTAAALLGLVWAFVDLEPRVEADFFFSSTDPQFRTQLELAETFDTAPQVFIAVRTSPVFSRRNLARLHALTRELAAVPGVASVQSLTRGPMEPEEVLERDPGKVRHELLESPFWSRLLLAPDGKASLLLLRLEELAGRELEATVTAIDAATRAHAAPDFEIGVSGSEYIGEHIRRGLSRDLRWFSVAALVAFTVLLAVLFRSPAAVVGMLAASLAACALTFLVRQAVGLRTGILTPNLWTIAFVLTLSHVVYLTASYRRLAREQSVSDASREAVAITGPPSLWSLVANLLGFASLLLAPAKPLREFGISGGIAALAAIACAYGLYPVFLRSVRAARADGPLERAAERFFTTRHPWLAAAIAIAALSLAPWAFRAETDPTATSYFARSGAMRSGIEAIDRAGGSVPLDLVVRDAAGGSLADRESYQRLVALQRDLERDPAVGAVLSIALLMQETKRPWYSFLAGWERRLDRLDSPQHERVGRAFIDRDRKLGRFILRMHDVERDEPTAAILERLGGIVERHGFEVAIAGGMFKLQGDMAALVRNSVERGLGGLLALFLVVAYIVSRSLRVALAMAACLALVPFALFGLVTLAGMPVDIISAPAANVALPMGIDEMIHLGYALRRGRREGEGGGWATALRDLWAPILASVTIVVAGFALFMLSQFPPTQRLGVLVCLGAALTDAVVLLVLPAATWRSAEGPARLTQGGGATPFVRPSRGPRAHAEDAPRAKIRG